MAYDNEVNSYLLHVMHLPNAKVDARTVSNPKNTKTTFIFVIFRLLPAVKHLQYKKLFTTSFYSLLGIYNDFL